MKFLELDEVIVIHDAMLKVGGGKSGIHDFSLLHSAVERPKAGFGSEYLYETVWLMAAALMYSLVKNHPFEDGNKRTAYFATMRFLYKNDWELIATENIYVVFMVEIDTLNKSVEEIATWLENNSRKIV